MEVGRFDTREPFRPLVWGLVTGNTIQLVEKNQSTPRKVIIIIPTAVEPLKTNHEWIIGRFRMDGVSTQ
jgi:hypothetical protein